MINRVSQPKVARKELNKNTSFKGAGVAALTGLRGLNNSPALGACAVDLCSMVIPRTAIEMKNRGPQSGIEAAFREGTSCLIHACVGLIGLGAATLLSQKFNKEHGIKAQNIFASGNTIENMHNIWKNANGQESFFESFLQSVKGLNGTEMKTVSDSARPEIAKTLVSLAEKTEEMSNATGSAKKELANAVKDLKNLVVAQITQDTGAQASFELEAGAKKVSSSIGELVDNAVSISNSFKNKTDDVLPTFVTALKKNKVASTLLGIGICAAMCMSVQPLNRYMTKKRTGQDGFVGVDNKEGDKSKGFKAAKTAIGLAFPAIAIKSIGNLSDLVSNIQFNSKVPTINQFKFLYSLTIGSRFLSARDGNELRESVIKDTLGYTNWLILGGMVSKLTARALGGKELINNPVVAENGKKGIKYAFKWLTKASVKSYDEVLLPAVKNIAKDGKVEKFTELFKKADTATKKKIFKIAGSQVAGYLYSGLVLGVGIAKLNIFITKSLQKKKNAQNTQNQNVSGLNYFKNQGKTSSIFKEFN